MALCYSLFVSGRSGNFFKSCFLFAGIITPLCSMKVEGVGFDAFVHAAVVEALTPKPTCQLITPFNSSGSFK